MKQTGMIALVVLTLAGTAQAHGRRHRHVEQALALARDAAVRYWGGVPCGGNVTVRYAPQDSVPQSDFGGAVVTNTWAWTGFQTPSGNNDYAQPASTYSDCIIYIVENWWTPLAEAGDFPDFCGLIVHEYGHLFGHPDIASDPPTSITYPDIGPLNERVAPCVARYRLRGIRDAI